jgi:cation diffusion facilitator family transporter
MAGSTAHILQSLAANSAIAVAKGVAAALCGSGAMLAETIHSAADCGNQALLLLGVRQSQRPPTAQHPLGHGRALYFWSFLVAMLLFSLGGVFSILEGLHKIRHPEPVAEVGAALAVLAFALLVEGWATLGNVRELNRRRGPLPFFAFLRSTKDSDLVVVFGENSAAVLGLLLALLALLLAKATGDGRWDGAGSLAVGLVLVAVAVFLAVEIQSLLLGERADPIVEATARRLAEQDPAIRALLRTITVQQGPGEVLFACKLEFADPQLPAAAVCRRINAFEAALQQAHPEVRWCFVEPDSHD